MAPSAARDVSRLREADLGRRFGMHRVRAANAFDRDTQARASGTRVRARRTTSAPTAPFSEMARGCTRSRSTALTPGTTGTGDSSGERVDRGEGRAPASESSAAASGEGVARATGEDALVDVWAVVTSEH